MAKIYSVLFEYIDFSTLNIPKFDFNCGNEGYNFELENEDEVLEALSIQLREYWRIGNSLIKDMKLLLESNGIIVT